MTDRFIITAKYTTQPPIDTPARQFTRTRSVTANCTIVQAYAWACDPAANNKYTTLDRVTVMPDE